MIDVSSYIKKMKEIADVLNASGQAILEGKLIAFIIDGLGPEYDLVIVHVYSKLDSSTDAITLAEVKFILQKYEQHLNRNNLVNLEVYGGTANVASQVRPNNMNTWRNPTQRFRSYNQPNTEQTSVTGENGIVDVQNVSDIRSKVRNDLRMRVVCQVCGKTGHFALSCYHRFDVTYIGNNRMLSEVNNVGQPFGFDEDPKLIEALFLSQAPRSSQVFQKNFQP